MCAAQHAWMPATVRRSDWRSLRAWALVAAVLATLLLLDNQRQRALLLPEASAATAAPLTLALLQGYIPQDEKFQFGSGIPMACARRACSKGRAAKPV